MNILLFGFKKCGKTYYGLKAAQRLHMHFVDTDILLEQYYHKLYHKELSYRDIAKQHGFPFFRNLEKHVVSQIMQLKNTVVSLGGGVVLDPDNVSRLEQTGLLVYLKASKQTLEHRILSGDHPAYIDSQRPVASFEEVYTERVAIYEKIPAQVIETEGMGEEEILETICSLVKIVE